MNILSANNLTFKYSETVIFDNASLEVKRGKITGIIGSNGSGKTTFFDILCNLRQPKSGTLKNLSKKHLYLSQTLGTPATLRMSDIYKMMLSLSTPEIISKQDILDKFNAWSPPLANRYHQIWSKKPSTCSYGEIRCFFTLSLLTIPADLIILDEPTAGVDPEFRYYTWLFLEKARDAGATVLVSSHSIDEIANYCDEFYMIANKTFNKFSSGVEFMQRYDATNLDEAFIKASTCAA
jgi:ABC-2 type transport system ATP-binding protein